MGLIKILLNRHKRKLEEINTECIKMTNEMKQLLEFWNSIFSKDEMIKASFLFKWRQDHIELSEKLRSCHIEKYRKAENYASLRDVYEEYTELK